MYLDAPNSAVIFVDQLWDISETKLTVSTDGSADWIHSRIPRQAGPISNIYILHSRLHLV
jgi:hypothetical protein